MTDEQKPAQDRCERKHPGFCERCGYRACLAKADQGEQKPGGLEGEGLSAIYRFAYESIRKGAPGLSDATCMAIARSINMKVSVTGIPAETRVRELERELAQANANGAAHWGRATAAEAKLARAAEGLRRIGYGDGGIGTHRAIAQQTLAALQQEGE